MLVRPCWTVRLKGGSGALGRVGGGQEPPPPKKIPGSATNAMPTILNATRRPDMKPHTRMRHPDVPSLPMQRLLEDGGRKISEMAGEPGRCTLGRSEEPYGETERSICCAICYSTQASPRKPQGSATVARASQFTVNCLFVLAITTKWISGPISHGSRSRRGDCVQKTTVVVVQKTTRSRSRGEEDPLIAAGPRGDCGGAQDDELTMATDSRDGGRRVRGG